MSDFLPEGFEALAPFAARFSIASTAGRAARRGDSTPEERQAFYNAAKDLFRPALDHLDTLPLGRLDQAHKRLLDMILAYAHIALAIEVQGPDEARHASLRNNMKLTRSPADP
jgi:hypothetical protein